jgi:hypothetical protein
VPSTQTPRPSTWSSLVPDSVHRSARSSSAMALLDASRGGGARRGWRRCSSTTTEMAELKEDEGAARPAKDGGVDRLSWRRRRTLKRSGVLLGRQRMVALLGYHDRGGMGIRLGHLQTAPFLCQLLQRILKWVPVWIICWRYVFNILDLFWV